ncbi:hypothetical protein GCM10012275_38540 [Longimycelium tulufanense]|uniref:Uncharacterized protein n=1 Tax=Longimycelium tulufanense TaxID=907463 RepID=A0A8J3FV18_9PSEU|nr:hypothetical protein [Longimycelium tulufanense]GGM64277.1 hypothetical protein GCM10012275_38540 [Longimycelium tulufanense]
MATDSLLPAGDPATDPLGTVRVHPEDHPLALCARRVIKLPIGREPYHYWRYLTPEITPSPPGLRDQDVAGWPIQPLAELAVVLGHVHPDGELVKELWKRQRDAANSYHRGLRSLLADLGVNVAPVVTAEQVRAGRDRILALQAMERRWQRRADWLQERLHHVMQQLEQAERKLAAAPARRGRCRCTPGDPDARLTGTSQLPSPWYCARCGRAHHGPQCPFCRPLPRLEQGGEDGDG